jgi:hypothetical protein
LAAFCTFSSDDFSFSAKMIPHVGVQSFSV